MIHLPSISFELVSGRFVVRNDRGLHKTHPDITVSYSTIGEMIGDYATKRALAEMEGDTITEQCAKVITADLLRWHCEYLKSLNDFPHARAA